MKGSCRSCCCSRCCSRSRSCSAGSMFHFTAGWSQVQLVLRAGVQQIPSRLVGLQRHKAENMHSRLCPPVGGATTLRAQNAPYQAVQAYLNTKPLMIVSFPAHRFVVGAHTAYQGLPCDIRMYSTPTITIDWQTRSHSPLTLARERTSRYMTDIPGHTREETS